MFGIGITEFMLIMIVALLVVGPEKLPDIARSLAKAYNEFRRAGNDIKKSVREMNLDSAEELIKGTVDKVVPERADPDAPGKGSGAFISRGASGRGGKESAGGGQQEASKRPALAPEGTASGNGEAAKESLVEKASVVEPVDFKAPGAAAGSAETATAAVAPATGTVKPPAATARPKKRAKPVKRASAGKKTVSSVKAAGAGGAKKGVKKAAPAKKVATSKRSPKGTAGREKAGS